MVAMVLGVPEKTLMGIKCLGPMSLEVWYHVWAPMAGVILGMKCQGDGRVWKFSHQPSTHPDGQASHTRSSLSNSSDLCRFVEK